MVGYPFNDEIYNAPFWADVANSNENYWTDLTLSFTSNIINIAEDSRMQLAGHNIMFDDIYKIVFPSTTTARTLTAYLEINNNTKTYEIKTTDSYGGDGGDLNNIYTVRFLEVRHPGGTVNINREIITVFYASTSKGIISAEDTGFSNSDYIEILLNRNKFDKIIWSEIKRLKQNFTGSTVFYDVSKFNSIYNSLEKIDIKNPTSMYLQIAPNTDECLLTINKEITDNGGTEKSSSTLKCNDTSLTLALVFEGSAVTYRGSNIKDKIMLVGTIINAPISNYTSEIEWDSNLDFKEAGYEKFKLNFNFEGLDDIATVTPMIVNIPLDDGYGYFGGLVETSPDVIGGNLGLFGRLNIFKLSGTNEIRIAGKIWSFQNDGGTIRFNEKTTFTIHSLQLISK